MRKIDKVWTRLTAAVALGLCMGAATAATVSVPNVTMPIAGGAVTMEATFTGDGTTVAYQCDITFDTNDVTVTSVTGIGTGLCSNPTPNTVRLLDGTPANTPMPNGSTCSIVFNVAPGADGKVIPLTLGNCTYNNSAGDEIPGNTSNGSITLIAEGPPTITFDTTPIALPAGVFGTPVSASVPATITPGGGNDPTDTASFTCSATAGFTVAPTSGGPFQNGDSLPAINVSATLGASAQNGNVNCTATNTDGSSVEYQIPVSAPAGAQTAPALGSTPASGSTIVLPVAPPGATVSSSIRIAATGGVGQNAATVSCSASGAVTVNPTSTLSFLPGAAAQNVSVQCSLLEDAEQTGSVTCTGTDGNGSFTWNYDVVCPMGVVAPAIVPATSAWSKFALIALFAGLGVMLVGFRRQH
jgi:hypothetical protein